MMEVYVIWWEWRDHSGAGIARVHSDKQRADEEIDLLTAMDSVRKYRLDEQPLYASLKDDPSLSGGQ